MVRETQKNRIMSKSVFEAELERCDSEHNEVTVRLAGFRHVVAMNLKRTMTTHEHQLIVIVMVSSRPPFPCPFLEIVISYHWQITTTRRVAFLGHLWSR